MKTRTSQADIARICGVSRSAVSAVLLGMPSTAVIGDKTRRCVEKAVRRLGYRRHSGALALRSGQTQAVAIAIPNTALIEGAITLQIVQGILERAHQTGYMVHICIYREQGNIHESMLRAVQESRVDGVFFFPDNRIKRDPRVAILRKSGLPFVALHKRFASGSSIDFDHVAGARLAVEHLLRIGRRRIALVGYEKKTDYSEQRRHGYLQALNQAGIPADPAFIIPAVQGNVTETGTSGVQYLLNARLRCDALFCLSDNIAMMAIQALAKRGLKVPKDFAVVGYDDSSVAELATPPLTSVHQDGREMGRQAMDMLLAQIQNPSNKVKFRLLPVRLVVRQSTAPDSG